MPEARGSGQEEQPDVHKWIDYFPLPPLYLLLLWTFIKIPLTHSSFLLHSAFNKIQSPYCDDSEIEGTK